MITKCSSRIGLVLLLASCTGVQKKQDVPVSQQEERQFNFGSLGDSGISVFSFGDKKEDNNKGAVNIPLWRASLDVLNFAPIAVSDSVGGIITTEWYTLQSKTERFKLSVRILSKNLRADALKVTIFKETFKNNQWVPQSEKTNKEKEFENLILNRAKKIRAS